VKPSRRVVYLAASVVLATATCAVAALAAARRPPSAAGAVRAFVATLRPEQTAKLRLPFDAEERLSWYYVPRARKGLPYQDMDAGQRKAALDLLASFLSRSGYNKVEAIRAREIVLAEIENDKTGSFRNPDRYFFSLFGEPSDQRGSVWGLRYEGHHISLHWTLVDGRVISSTPQFLGSNPARLTSGPRAGDRILVAEEDLGRALARSLTGEQKARGVASAVAPGDILTGNQRKAAIQEDTGVAYRDLNAQQRGLLLGIIREYASVQPEKIAKSRLEAIQKAGGMDGVKFLWMGSLEPGQGHYYRVQGKTFLIEYDNTQNHANHVHTVWRDFDGDFGEDVLADHYKRFPPGSQAGHGHGHGHDH
jgi:hypothetical protein